MRTTVVFVAIVTISTLIDWARQKPANVRPIIYKCAGGCVAGYAAGADHCAAPAPCACVRDGMQTCEMPTGIDANPQYFMVLFAALHAYIMTGVCVLVIIVAAT